MVLGIVVLAMVSFIATVDAAPIRQIAPATPTPIMPYAKTAANLYAGPGVEFGVVGAVAVGQVIPIVQVSVDGQWYRSSNGAIGPWVAASALSNPPRPENLWPLTPIAQSAPYVAPTPTALVMAAPVVLPTEMPTATPNPDLAEIITAGEWSRASYERKVNTTLLWANRLVRDNMITGDPTSFAVELYRCVDSTIQDSLQVLGEDHLATDIAATCAFLLSEAPATATPVPVVEMPTATSVVVFATVQPLVATCDCSGDFLNCEDFDNHASAQACYQYCVDTVGFDINGLDGNDDDGLACESLP